MISTNDIPVKNDKLIILHSLMKIISLVFIEIMLVMYDVCY